MEPKAYESELLDRMLTVNEIAHLLHIHPRTVRRWEKKGQLKSYRFGPKSVIRFKREDLSNFINCDKNCRKEKATELSCNFGSRARTQEVQKVNDKNRTKETSSSRPSRAGSAIEHLGAKSSHED